MNTTTEYREMLALYKHFEALVDDAFKAAKVAEADAKTSQEEMDILYDRCDKALEAKHHIDNALEAMRRLQEVKAVVARMEQRAQELTNKAQELATAYLNE